MPNYLDKIHAGISLGNYGHKVYPTILCNNCNYEFVTIKVKREKNNTLPIIPNFCPNCGKPIK